MVARGDGILVTACDRNLALNGRLYALLAPHLDGEETVDEIVAQLSGRASAAEVHWTLGQLESAGILANPAPDGGKVGLLLAVGAPPPARGLGVEVVANGADDDVVSAALAQVGCRRETGAGAALVVTRDIDDEALDVAAERFRESGTPWLLVRLGPGESWLGPLMAADRGACFACLRARLEGNRRAHALAPRRSVPLAAPRSPAPFAVAILARAAAELAAWLTHAESPLATSLLVLDPSGGKLSRHPVARRPQCPRCGDASLLASRATSPPPLRSSPRDGRERIRDSDATVRSLLEHVSPLTGVVRELERVPIDGGTLHVYRSGFNVAMAVDDVASWLRVRAHVSGGKGATVAEAQASALGEALERYSATSHGDEATTRAARRDLGASAIDPRRVLLFSDEQYRRRDALGASGIDRCRDGRRAGDTDRRRVVPAPFDESAVIDWVPVWPLRGGARAYLPAACAFLGFRDTAFATADSNGCAAGADLTEAALYGLYELIERDAVAIWWYNRLRRPGIPLTSFDDEYLDGAAGAFAKTGWELWLLDLTHDLEVPCCAAIAIAEDGDVATGFGAHLDARVAARRAVSEAAQMLGFRAEAGVSLRAEVPTGRSARVELEAHPYLRPHGTAAPGGSYAGTDARADLEFLVARAARSGLESYLLDMTRPDIGLAVARVIVPGLRHFWPRFAPGRLYDVPVAMGWRDQPIAEADLNPFPTYF